MGARRGCAFPFDRADRHERAWYAPDHAPVANGLQPESEAIIRVSTVTEPSQSSSEPKFKLNAELVIDKFIDFVLIFVGLYAATALQRYQDVQREKDEYVALLHDFERELAANLAQEKSIEKDLGALTDTEPGKNLGPMTSTFTHFFEELEVDEHIVHCLHVEFASGIDPEHPHEPSAECHAAYKKFDQDHQTGGEHFNFKPAVLTPFYRYEVWDMYLADGIKTFRNKELAVKIGEIYNNARIIERQVADIETTYNDAFMTQVGRTAATDLELAEVVHDEETEHGLSAQDQQILINISEAVKEEHYAAVEVRSILELKVERMKRTALLLRQEIVDVTKAIKSEIGRQTK